MVDEWLTAHNVDPASVTRSPAGDWVSCSVPVSKAEEMMGTKYNVFRNTVTGSSIVRARSYSLPRSLKSHVELVQPTTFFGFRDFRTHSHLQPDVVAPQANDFSPSAKLSPQGTVPASCNTTITPACLRGLYNTVNYVPAATATNKLGVAGYLQVFFFIA